MFNALVACGRGNETQPVHMSLIVMPQAVEAGDNISISWKSSNATACTASGAWSGDKPMSGTEIISTKTTGSLDFTLNCKNNSSASSKVQTVVVNPLTKASININAATGGSVDLPDIATVSVPAGALVTNTRVVVQKTNESRVQNNFVETASIFSATNNSHYQVRIDAGKEQPASAMSVILKVPASILTVATSSQEIRALYLNVYQDSMEGNESMEILPERASATATSITVIFPREAFYLSESGRYEAFLLLATTDRAKVTTQANRVYPPAAAKVSQ